METLIMVVNVTTLVSCFTVETRTFSSTNSLYVNYFWFYKFSQVFMLGPHRRNCLPLESRAWCGAGGAACGRCSGWLGREQPIQGPRLEVGLSGRGLGTLGDARVNWVHALLCHDVSCLHNILLLFGVDAGDSARLLLRGETCLKMENMVYYLWLLQQCLVGLLDAGLPSGGAAQIRSRKSLFQRFWSLDWWGRGAEKEVVCLSCVRDALVAVSPAGGWVRWAFV